MLSLPWQIPSFPQLPCDGCLPGTPKHCRGAQQFSGWTHPAWLAPGFSAAAGWPDCTGTLAPLEYWSCTESSSSSSGPGVIERLTHHVYNSKWNLHKSENKNNAGQIGLKALIRQQHQAYYSISFGFLLKNYTLWNIFLMVRFTLEFYMFVKNYIHYKSTELCASIPCQLFYKS